MEFTVPTDWNECSEAQLASLTHCLYTAPEGLAKALHLLTILFCPTRSLRQHYRFWRLQQSVPITELLPYLSFLGAPPKIYTFPEIAGLKAPNVYMGNFTIEHFSVADKLFYDFISTREGLALRRFVASVYTMEAFSKENLPKVAEITDKHPKLHYRILLGYLSCREKIINSYPEIFPQKEENSERPQFHTPSRYTPFSEIMLTLAFDNPQPLGNYAQIKQTHLYEFFNVLTQSIVRQRALEKLKS